jgi:exopolysaccharide production protein ExoZ
MVEEKGIEPSTFALRMLSSLPWISKSDTYEAPKRSNRAYPSHSIARTGHSGGVIPSVQYLRGIAAMMVVWHHSLGQIPATQEFIRVPELGSWGVQLFFVISGFIMLVTTWEKPITPMQFMANRIKRIVPLYWLVTVALAGIAILAPSVFKTLKWEWVDLAKSLLFVPYWNTTFPDMIAPLLLPGWSLDYEMFFYGLFALALLMRREWRVPVMVGTMGVLIVGGLLWHPTSAPGMTYTNHMMLEFAGGMVLGRWWVSKKHPRRDGGHPILMALGDASYSIYLTHIFTLGALRIVWVRFVPVASLGSSLAWLALAVPVCALTGYACYRLVEKPITVAIR